MIEALKTRTAVIALAFVMAITAMFGVQMATAGEAEAGYTGYCGYSYTSHYHYNGANVYTYHYTYYGGTNANGYEWNDYWYWIAGSWYYDGWDWRYC